MHDEGRLNTHSGPVGKQRQRGVKGRRIGRSSPVSRIYPLHLTSDETVGYGGDLSIERVSQSYNVLQEGKLTPAHP